jgi:hypothetical protein
MLLLLAIILNILEISAIFKGSHFNTISLQGLSGSTKTSSLAQTQHTLRSIVSKAAGSSCPLESQMAPSLVSR